MINPVKTGFWLVVGGMIGYAFVSLAIVVAGAALVGIGVGLTKAIDAAGKGKVTVVK